MTSLAHRDRAASQSTAAGVRQRIAGLLRTEIRLLHRFGVFTAAAVVTALWVAILLVVPAATRQAIVPLVLLVDVTALGFLFIPALLVLERMERVEPAMRLTPVRTIERVGVRVGLTTTLSLVAGLVVTVAARAPSIPVALSGVATASVLIGLIAFVAIGTSATLTTILLRGPLFAGPLLAPALIAATGLVDTPVLYLSPMTSALDMMRGRMTWPGMAWQVVWVLAAAVLVGRNARRPVAGDAPVAARGPAATWPAHPGRYSRRAVVRSFARADRRSLLHDGLLIMIAVSIPLLAIIGRIASTAGVTWVRQRHGVDLAAYLPVAWVILLVAHTPVMLGSLTGLLLLEDRDAGLLPAIATTPASIDTLLRYRLTVTAVSTAAALAIAFAVAGVDHPAGIVGLASVTVAAAALSPVPALLMAAFARNRVQGVAVMKILGLPLYLPVASWFIAVPARWLFAPLPSSWAMWSLWAQTPTGALAFAGGAIVVCSVATVALSRRFLRRATER